MTNEPGLFGNPIGKLLGFFGSGDDPLSMDDREAPIIKSADDVVVEGTADVKANKTIVICFDGTSNDDFDPNRTNVYKVYAALKDSPNHKVIYVRGTPSCRRASILCSKLVAMTTSYSSRRSRPTSPRMRHPSNTSTWTQSGQVDAHHRPARDTVGRGISVYGIHRLWIAAVVATALASMGTISSTVAVQEADRFSVFLPVLQTPPGTQSYSSVSVVELQACGQRSDGAVRCWDWSGADVSPRVDQRFVQVSAGCGVVEDGSIRCWRLDGSALPSPDGIYAAVDGGMSSPCAIDARGHADCWMWEGPADDIVMYPSPPGPFRQVSVSLDAACGLRPDGSVVCWSFYSDESFPGPEGSFAQVSVFGGPFDGEACALTDRGAIECWVWGEAYAGRVPVGSPGLSGTFEHVSLGHEGLACGVRTGGALACWIWGSDGPIQYPVPSGRFQQVEVGLEYACGVAEDGTLSCWSWQGPDSPLEPRPVPSG